MCGIIGYLGNRTAGEIIFEGLKRLEYRGYDSAGIVTLGSDLKVKKDKGGIGDLNEKYDLNSLKGNKGIGHIRWATHGSVTKENAHPHLCCSKRVAIVHNGIIENYREIKEELQTHSFSSETDSEVIAHYFGEHLNKGKNPREIMKDFIKKVEGTFAVLVLDKDTKKIYAMKKDSPLSLGIKDNEAFIASDIYAFSNYTDQAVFFKDNEFAVIDKASYKFYNKEGREVEKEIKEFEWEDKEEKIGKYQHWMIKEIKEQPITLKRLNNSLKFEQKNKLKKLVKLIKAHEKIIFVAAGTSYHASLLGVYLLQKAGIDSQALIASEFKNYERVDSNTLVIAVSQSGETMDTIEAIKYSKEKGGTIASIVNVPHSTIQRKSTLSLEILAGQEKCVAATKTFTNQVFLLFTLAKKFGLNSKIENLNRELNRVIEKNESKIKRLASELKNSKDIYVIGRGIEYPIARELALKLKEISYIHAEGMMGGELKHGTLALIEKGTPVISLIPEKNSKIKSNVKEVEARGAKSIKISPFEGIFEIPKSSKKRFVFFSTVLGFLLTYWIARKKGLPVDKPRNLSKSITVS